MRKTILKVEHQVSPFKKQKKVAAYARVSVESERMQHSLSAQVSYYSGLIQKNPEWEYAGVYADYGISGTGMAKRDAFNKMIAVAEAGKIDIILTKAIQRFARNTVDLLNTVRHLKDIGVEVWFEKENIHTLSGEGELMLTILASFAQEESRSISENIKWRVQKRFQQGMPPAKFFIYGYRWEGDKLVIVPEEAAVVRRIYQNFLDGKSRVETRRELAAKGIKTRHGNNWGDPSIKQVLTNITYTGNLLLQKTYIEDPITKKERKNRGERTKYFVENTHEAIIDKKTFDYVQKEMARRCKLGAFANKSLHTTCFTGKIKCGVCGKSYVSSKRKYKGRHIGYWGCTSHKYKGKNCGAKGTIPQIVLERECAAVLGLQVFDENIFLEKVDTITVPEYHVMVFNMKDGRKIVRHWKSTANKESWTEKLKDRQRVWTKRYRMSGKSERYSVFTDRILCVQCNICFKRCLDKRKNGSVAYWRCKLSGKSCKIPGIREDPLKQMAATVLGLPVFDDAVFRKQIDHIETGKADELIFCFSDGRRKSCSWPPVKTGNC